MGTPKKFVGAGCRHTREYGVGMKACRLLAAGVVVPAVMIVASCSSSNRGAGEQDDGGSPVDAGPIPAPASVDTLLTEPMGLISLAQNATDLFVTTYDDRVLRVPKSGGSSSTLATVHQANGLAADADSVYAWASVNNTATVVRVHIADGTSTAVTDGFAGRLAVDTDTLYGGPPLQAPWSVPTSGGTPTFLTTTEVSYGPMTLFVRNGFVYYEADADATSDASPNSPSLQRVPKGGGAPQTMATFDGTLIKGLEADDQDAYVCSDKSVFAVGLGGGAPTKLASQANCEGVVPGGRALFVGVWTATDKPHSGVFAMPKTGGPLAVYSPLSKTFLGRMLTDASYVYWTEDDGGSNGVLLRAPLPP
jgi:hypothetical protein